MLRDAGLAGEALALLLWARLTRRLVPMRRWSRVLGTPASPTGWTPAASGPPTGLEAAIALAVDRAAARAVVTVTCLDRATAAQVMLRRRGRAGVVVIGLAPQQAWGAHAWVVGRTGVVVGAREAAAFSPATIFR